MIEIDEVFEAKIVSGGRDPVELLQQGDLRVFVFDHRLDHEANPGHVPGLGGRLDAAHHAVALLGLEAPALDHPPQVARDRIDPALAKLRRDIVHHDGDFRLRGDLRDPRSHLPRPDDADLLQIHSPLPKLIRVDSVTGASQ